MTTQTQIPRYSKNAITSDRASGYKSTTHALAELVDNSFDWGAKHVKVFFIDQAFDNTAPQISEILVADDGIGMDDDTLFRCLIIGDGLNIEQGYLGKGRTGKFGYGLPKGSISQCKTTRVFSRQNGDKFKRNILEVEPPSNLANNIEKIEPPPYYTEIGAILSAEAGTIISWSDLDRLNAKRAETLISRCESLFGKMHRYSLKEANCELIHCRRESNGVVQILSKTTVRPNDPLFLMEDTVVEKYLQAGVDGDDHEVAEHYAEFLKEGGGCLPTSELFQEFPIHFEWKEKTYRFDITVSKAKIEIQKPGVREGGKKEVGKFYVTKGIESIQTPENISFVREHRELDSGRFRVKLKAPGAEQHRWWAVEVKFGADADELMGVENSKQGVAFSYSPGITHEEWQQQKFTASEIEARDALFSRLSKVLEEAASQVYDKIREENKEWDSQDQEETVIPQEDEITREQTEEVDGERESTWSEVELQKLFKKLCELFPKLDEGAIREQVEICKKKSGRSILLYNLENGSHLWDLESVNDYLIITVNMNHPFYEKIIAPMRDTEDNMISSIELMIKALAKGENDLSGDEKERTARFRNRVSLYIDEYLSA